MKKILLMSVLMIAAIVVGGLIGDVTAGVSGLQWLAYSKSFAFQPNTFIDVDIFSLTFGVTFKANVAQLILIFVGLFAYYKIAPKLITK